MKIEDIDKTWDLFSKHDNAKQMLERLKGITDIRKLMDFIESNKYDIELPDIKKLKQSAIGEVNKLIKDLEDQIKAI